MNDYEEKLLLKIDNGEELNESELSELSSEHVDKIEGENRRWSRSVTSIVQLGERYFSIDWEEGLTEMQENEYDNQPVEVKQKTEMVEVTKWINV